MITHADVVVHAMHPEWVPYADGEERSKRNVRPGPNGEKPGTGRWKLRFPRIDVVAAAFGVPPEFLPIVAAYDTGGIYAGPTLSPSAVGRADECLHKWGLSRLDNHEEPQSDSAAVGEGLHAELEAWHTQGDAPSTPGMAKVIASFPSPGQCESECYTGFACYWREVCEECGADGYQNNEHQEGCSHASQTIWRGPFVFAGYVDVRQSVLTPARAGGTLLNSVIHDLKTTGSFDWKKSASQLRADLQGAVYALAEMSRVDTVVSGGKPATDIVILKWHYALVAGGKGKTKANGPRVTRVEVVSDDTSDGVAMTREDAVAALIPYLPTCERMLEAINGNKKAIDLEKNVDGCGSYGGCKWKKPEVALCDPPSGFGFMARMKQEREREARKSGQVAQTTTSGASKPGGAKKMGLGARFAKKLNGEASAPAAAVANGEVAQKPKEKPAAGSPRASRPRRTSSSVRA